MEINLYNNVNFLLIISTILSCKFKINKLSIIIKKLYLYPWKKFIIVVSNRLLFWENLRTSIIIITDIIFEKKMEILQLKNHCKSLHKTLINYSTRSTVIIYVEHYLGFIFLTTIKCWKFSKERSLLEIKIAYL